MADKVALINIDEFNRILTRLSDDMMEKVKKMEQDGDRTGAAMYGGAVLGISAVARAITDSAEV